LLHDILKKSAARPQPEIAQVPFDSEVGRLLPPLAQGVTRDLYGKMVAAFGAWPGSGMSHEAAARNSLMASADAYI